MYLFLVVVHHSELLSLCVGLFSGAPPAHQETQRHSNAVKCHLLQTIRDLRTNKTQRKYINNYQRNSQTRQAHSPQHVI